MNQINWSRIISVLTVVSGLLTFALHYGGGFIPVEWMPLITGLHAGILAFTERITGGASKI